MSQRCKTNLEGHAPFGRDFLERAATRDALRESVQLVRIRVKRLNVLIDDGCLEQVEDGVGISRRRVASRLGTVLVGGSRSASVRRLRLTVRRLRLTIGRLRLTVRRLRCSLSVLAVGRLLRLAVTSLRTDGRGRPRGRSVLTWTCFVRTRRLRRSRLSW